MNKNLFLMVLAVAVLGFAGFYLFNSYSGQGSNLGSIAGLTGNSRGNNQIALDITSPMGGSTVSTPTTTIVGTTAPNADVSINDSEIKADASGNFTFTFQLDEGDNDIVVTANDANGASAEKEFVVTYTPVGQ